MPKNYFNNEKENKGDKSTPIFQEEYAKNAKAKNRNLESVGKQDAKGANSTYTLTGVARNSKTGAPINNLTISTRDRSHYAATNSKGYFSITLPSGLNKIETNLLGYNKLYKDVVVYGDGSLNLKVEENAEMLDEVLIESNKNQNVRDAVLGVTSINIEKIKEIPLVLGERDLLKVAVTLPGITQAGEGASGYNVRGGRADQNLILLDEGVIYNPTHFLGLFSAIIRLQHKVLIFIRQVFPQNMAAVFLRSSI